MNNLTNEERARIFAMYYGAEVQTGFKETYVVNGNIISDIASVWPMHNDAKLLLNPLPKITDEHAIEVAKIWKPDYEWKVIGKDQFDCLLMVECSDYIMWFDFMGSSFDFEEKYTGEENIEAHGCEKEETSCERIVEIIDCIRELGYALPYKGQSLFDLGIAIDKTTL